MDDALLLEMLDQKRKKDATIDGVTFTVQRIITRIEFNNFLEKMNFKWMNDTINLKYDPEKLPIIVEVICGMVTGWAGVTVSDIPGLESVEDRAQPVTFNRAFLRHYLLNNEKMLGKLIADVIATANAFFEEVDDAKKKQLST